jgi:hypothetical protein
VNSTQAQTILLAWRPGHGDLRDPEVAAALDLARRDPALKSWLDRHSDFQRAVARSFQELPVPGGLRARILAGPKIIAAPIPWWRKPGWLSAAAVVALLLGLAAWWVRPPSEHSLSAFRNQMVGFVLRQYAMELVTNDLAQIRAYLKRQQAPSDFVLPENLGRQPLLGADVLGWRRERVSMVCLQSPARDTLFLFIVNRASVDGATPITTEFAQVNKLMTVSWTQGGWTYVLAGSGSRESLQPYVPAGGQ